MIGTTAALIMAGISAAGSVASAKIQANAANKAAGTQAQSGQDALQIERDAYNNAQQRLDQAALVQKQIYDENKGNFDPYRSLGASAASTLGAAMGLPVAMSAPASSSSRGVPSGGMSVPAVGTGGLSPYRPGNAQGIVRNGLNPPLADPNARSGQLADAAGGFGTSIGRALQRSQQDAAIQTRQSSYVTMRAPNGETQPVPSNQVDHFTRMGATVVG